MKLLTTLSLFAMLLLTGCSPDKERERAEFKLLSQMIEDLPPGATNITDIGKKWYTFECQVNNKNRTFLFRIYQTSGHWAVGTITELIP